MTVDRALAAYLLCGLLFVLAFDAALACVCLIQYAGVQNPPLTCFEKSSLRFPRVHFEQSWVRLTQQSLIENLFAKFYLLR